MSDNSEDKPPKDVAMDWVDVTSADSDGTQTDEAGYLPVNITKAAHETDPAIGSLQGFLSDTGRGSANQAAYTISVALLEKESANSARLEWDNKRLQNQLTEERAAHASTKTDLAVLEASKANEPAPKLFGAFATVLSPILVGTAFQEGVPGSVSTILIFLGILCAVVGAWAPFLSKGRK